jgi:hypothetical protein
VSAERTESTASERIKMLAAVLPLRVSVDVNLQEQLSKFLDQSVAAADAEASTGHPSDANAPRRPDFDSFECQGDLIRLDTLRKSSLTALSAGYEAAVAALPTLQEYAAALKEAEEKGFPGMDKETGAHSDSYNHNPSVKHIQLTWNN